MLSRTALTLALAITSFSATASALMSCGVCPSSIFFQGLTRTLTVQTEEGDNTVQCNFNNPPIQSFSPVCLYQNVNGAVKFTNTGGACPPIQLVQKISCT